jgi:hypothetical protein
LSSDAVIFRFHGERSEYRLTDTKPKAGEVLKHDGVEWFVVSVEAVQDGPTVVTLRPVLRPE